MFDKITGLLFGAVLIVMGIVGLANPPAAFSQSSRAQATVEVLIGDVGHGSGVHIGNGYVLTAGHVAMEGQTLTVLDTKGFKHATEVLWVNKKYDVALLHIESDSKVSYRDLSCRRLMLGEAVTFRGNPLMVENATTWGRVAKTDPQQIADWKSVVIVDAQIIPGMSGGPALDAAGKVVGINVGTFTQYAMGIIVPSETVCALLARK